MTDEQTTLEQEELAGGNPGVDEIDSLVEQAADDAEQQIQSEGEAYLDDGEDQFVDPEEGDAGQEAEQPNQAQPNKTTAVANLREAMSLVKAQIGEENYQRVMAQYDDSMRKSQILEVLMQDPRAKKAFEAVYGSQDQQPQQEQGGADRGAIDFAAVDRALEEGQSVGQVIQTLVQQALAQGRIQIQQELMGQIEQTMLPTVQTVQQQQAATAFSSFATNHPGLMEDMELRGVMGEIIRNHPSVMADVPGRNETFDQKMLRVKKYAEAELGRSVHTPKNRQTLPQKHRQLAARAMGRTGRNVPRSTINRAKTLEEAAEMAEQEIAGMRR